LINPFSSNCHKSAIYKAAQAFWLQGYNTRELFCESLPLRRLPPVLGDAAQPNRRFALKLAVCAAGGVGDRPNSPGQVSASAPIPRANQERESTASEPP
jgi:hypothetical protein